jgi:hypothetical protein
MKDQHKIGELVVRTIAWTHYWHMIGLVTEVEWDPKGQRFCHKVEWLTATKADSLNWRFEELTPIREIDDEKRRSM